MGFTYGHRATAFNGIWLWLQRNNYTKATRNADKSYSYCINMISEYLKSKEVKIVKYHGRFDTMKNAMAVQKDFQDFVRFMKGKEVPGEKA